MKSLIKDKKAILNPLLSAFFSFFIIVVMFLIFMPFMEYLTTTLIHMGAPQATALLYMKYLRWGFILFAVAALIVLFANIWKKTHDTGSVEMFR